MAHRSTWLLLLTFSIALDFGCGSDHGADSSPAATSGNGVRAAAGSGGRSTVSTGAAGASGVACGNTSCASDPLLGGLIAACCADASTSTCGTVAPDGACSPPAQSDPRCPSVNFMGAFMLASCCTADDQCGIDASMFGLGCMSLGQAGGSFGGAGILPAARACDSTDAGPADAGN
jgi:hypothetical protein